MDLDLVSRRDRTGNRTFAERSVDRAIRVHWLAIASALALCLGLPRPDSEILLISLTPSSPLAGLDLRSGSGLTLTGPGQIPGTIMIHAEQPVSVLALLRRGIVAVAIPTSLCAGKGSRAPTPEMSRQDHPA